MDQSTPFLGLPGPEQTLSPAQAKMKARADALAAEQAQRRIQNQELQAQAQAQRQASLDALAAEQFARSQEPVIDNRMLSGQNLTYEPLAQRQAVINAAQGGPASYYGDQLTMTPLAQRQAAIEQQQREVFGFEKAPGAPRPTQPQRPPQMRRPPMAPPPQQPRGPVRPQGMPPQGFMPQQRAPQPQPQSGGGGGVMQYAPLLAPLAPVAMKGISGLFNSLF